MKRDRDRHLHSVPDEPQQRSSPIVRPLFGPGVHFSPLGPSPGHIDQLGPGPGDPVLDLITIRIDAVEARMDAISRRLRKAEQSMTTVTEFQRSLIAVKAEMEAARKRLTAREWATLMDIVNRYSAHELGDDSPAEGQPEQIPGQTAIVTFEPGPDEAS